MREGREGGAVEVREGREGGAVEVREGIHLSVHLYKVWS